MDDVLSGKIPPDSIEPQYILVAPGKKSPRDKFIEGINYLAKFGWRSVGYSHNQLSIVTLGRTTIYCLMEKVE